MNRPSVTDCGRRRAASPHTSMFLRMLRARGRAAPRPGCLRTAGHGGGCGGRHGHAQSLCRRASQAAPRISQIRRERRRWCRSEGQAPSAGALNTVRSVRWQLGHRGSVRYAVARTLTATRLSLPERTSIRCRSWISWWSVTAWPKAPGEALVGRRATGVARLRTSRSISAFRDTPPPQSCQGLCKPARKKTAGFTFLWLISPTGLTCSLFDDRNLPCRIVANSGHRN